MLLAVLEIGARIFNRLSNFPKSQYEFRKTQPAPYQYASYFSQEFIAESFKQPGGWSYPKGTRLIIPNDFKGKYFNIEKGRRVTAYQPQNYERTVYVFGGSAVYGSEVPDNLTIPSLIQELFNKQYGNRFIVENLGTTTVTISQQLERLKRISLKRRDIVIFYDGANDIIMKLFYANRNESFAQRNQRVLKEMSFLQWTVLYLYYKFSDYSEFVRRFFNPNSNLSIPKHLMDETEMKNLLNILQTEYQDSIVAASEYSRQKGADFFHFLQPSLFTVENKSDYEKRLIRNYYINPNGMAVSFERGYPILKKIGKSLQGKVYSSDLSKLLNNRRKGEEYFLDFCHVTHEANQIIAENIFNSIHGSISNSSFAL